MKRFYVICCALTYLLALSAYAAVPVIQNVTIAEITKGSAVVVVDTDVDSTITLNYGNVPTYGNTTSGGPAAKKLFLYLSGLTPSTQYYICPVARDTSGNVSSCGGTSNQYTFQTPAANSSQPDLPNLPGHFINSSLFTVGNYPTINGTTYNVASDCSNLQTQINAAAADDPNKHHEVVIPAGADCSIVGDTTTEQGPSINIPSRAAGTGEVVIRSSGIGSLPAEGLRVSSSYSSSMATLRANLLVSGYYGTFRPACTASNQNSLFWEIGGTSGPWRLSQCTGTTFNLLPVTNFSGSIAVSCSANSWYNKTDAPQLAATFGNVLGIYWCDPNSKLRQMRLGNGQMMQIKSGAQRYRFVGLRFVPVQLPNFAPASEPFTPGNYSAGFVNIASGASNLVFDRNVFAGLPPPTKISSAIVSLGSKLQFTGNSFEDVGFGHESSATWQKEHASSFGLMMHGGQYINVINNYFDVATISLFATNDVANISTNDVIVRRNYFVRPRKYWYQDPANIAYGGKYYNTRHHLEIKRGQRWLIEGNVSDGNYSTINQAASFMLSARPNTTTNLSLNISDIAIQNNIIKNTPVGFMLGSHHTGNDLQVRTAQRILVKNNLMYGIIPNLMVNIPGGVQRSLGNCFDLWFGMEDVTLENNTCVDNQGLWPMSIWMQYEYGAFFAARNNILWNRLGSGWGGAVNAISAQPPQPTRGTASLNYFVRSNWTFEKNGIVNILNDPTTLYPATNLFVPGLSNVMFVDATTNNYQLQSASPFKNQGTNGADLGVDFGVLNPMTQGVTSGTPVNDTMPPSAPSGFGVGG